MDIVTLFSVVSAVVTGASVIVKGAQVIAKLTPTDKDDAILERVANGVGFIGGALHFLSMNVPALPEQGGQQKQGGRS